MSRGRNGAVGGAKGARRATVAAAAAVRGGKGRWSARRKITVVLELLRGAEMEATSRKYSVTAAGHQPILTVLPPARGELSDPGVDASDRRSVVGAPFLRQSKDEPSLEAGRDSERTAAGPASDTVEGFGSDLLQASQQ